MTTEERQAITIDTLTKRIRSALDSARDHQRNALLKEIQLCEAKAIMRQLVDASKSVDRLHEVGRFVDACEAFLYK